MIAAYVSEWLPPQAASDRHRQLDVRARLQVLRGAVDEILPDGANGRQVAIYDVPAHTASRGLHDLATSEGARAIVLGSTHRGPVGRVAVGATGARLLVKAPCSLAVAPRGFREHRNKRLERVAVAVDGCADCEDALHEAMSLTSALAGSLVALAVVPLPGRIRATPRRAEELFARVGSMLERCGAGDMKRQGTRRQPSAGHSPGH